MYQYANLLKLPSAAWVTLGKPSMTIAKKPVELSREFHIRRKVWELQEEVHRLQLSPARQADYTTSRW